MNRFLALLILTMGFATAARADYIPATWTDSITFSGVTLAEGSRTSRLTYTHDVTEDGFRPLNDVIKSFDLTLWLADDQAAADGSERARIDLNILGLVSGGNFQTSSFGLVGTEFGGWSILGLIQLNFLGTLTVTISSVYGDFNLLGSNLTAYGGRQTTVPEPTTLALLGIGLLGMALTLRRRPASKG